MLASEYGANEETDLYMQQQQQKQPARARTRTRTRTRTRLTTPTFNALNNLCDCIHDVVHILLKILQLLLTVSCDRIYRLRFRQSDTVAVSHDVFCSC